MAGFMARLPMSHRIFTPHDIREFEFSGEPAMSMSDTVFGFLHVESDGTPENNTYDEYNKNEQQIDEDDESEHSGSSIEDNKKFWENQHQLLKETLRRTSSLESNIRNCTKEALREAKAAGNVCSCLNPVFGGCRNCLMKEVSVSLQNAGFNSAICKSKWKNLPDLPSGEHTFVDVLEPNTKKEVRVIVELNFRGEFEMAKASEEYNLLVGKLPEVFVGKIERLLSITSTLCSAAKKCMKEKKMHLGPWRKTRYMQAKWLRVSERRRTTVMELMSAAAGYSTRPPRHRASMLTVDLLEKMSSVQCSAVEVV